jgi:hypothetical protein
MLVPLLLALLAAFLTAAVVFFVKGLSVRREGALARAALAARGEPRFAGQKRGKGARPELCVPITRIPIEGRDLSVTVYHHAFPSDPGEIPCWTYVSDGLRAHGQKEIVFTVACREGEPVDTFPDDPIELAALIHDLAKQGRVVDIGGRTELGDRGPGILGNDAFRGLLYTPPQASNFPPPDSPFLVAVALTRGELHLAMEQGMVRMMSLLGYHYRFYPMPPWIDRDRKEIAHVDAMRASILDKVPRAYLTDLTVCEEVTAARRIEREQPEVGLTKWSRRGPSRIHVRVGPKAASMLMELLAEPQAAQGFALLAGLEPTADACLIWKPGQTEPTAIGPEGRLGSRTCGNFLIVVPGQDKCEGRLVEDGFGMTLTRAAWADLRAAIAAREPLLIACEGEGMGFELSFAEQPPYDLPPRRFDAEPYDA